MLEEYKETYKISHRSLSDTCRTLGNKISWVWFLNSSPESTTLLNPFKLQVLHDQGVRESFHLSSVQSTCKAGDPSSIPGSGRSPGEGIGYPLQGSWTSLVVQLVKNLPAMWETWVQSLGWEDPQRRERLPTPVFWPGEFHGLSPWGRKEWDMNG